MMLIVRYILSCGFFPSPKAIYSGSKRVQKNTYDNASSPEVEALKARPYLRPLFTRAKIAGDFIRGDIV